MKKTLTRIFCCGLATILAMGVSTASAATLASWTFETSIPTTAGPHAAEVGTGSALGFHSGATAYSNPSGNGTTESFSSTNWVVGDYYQFSAPATGLATYSLTWDHTSSGTGPRDFALQYSTDGTTYTQIGGTKTVLANATPNPVWNVTTASPIYTLTDSISATATGTIYFRVTQLTTSSAGGGTVASGGTSRVDTVILASVPEPASVGLALCGALGLLSMRRRQS